MGNEEVNMRDQANKINPLAQKLFSELGKKPDQASEVASLAAEFIARSRDTLGDDDKGLISFLFLRYFQDRLSEADKVRVGNIFNEFNTTGSVLGEIRHLSDVTAQEVRGFFRSRSREFDYFVPRKLDNPLAQSVMALEMSSVAAAVKRELPPDAKNLVVEPFVNPQTGEVGVWMSTNGKQFDPKIFE